MANIKDVTRKLSEAQSLIQKAERNIAETEGQLKSLYSMLKKDFDVATVLEGEKLLKKMEKEIDGREGEIEKLSQKMDEILQ